ncbi:UNVERIFIED_CONTAM: hypothetical protein Sangu_2688100 [Sesamum angustifolium]|uniref:Uncharacterized protein n=1 Tax=Sesamum angustifolium TaxID=2727405 RepID=A0AAW2IZ72_9LAMI
MLRPPRSSQSQQEIKRRAPRIAPNPEEVLVIRSRNLQQEPDSVLRPRHAPKCGLQGYDRNRLDYTCTARTAKARGESEVKTAASS